MPIVVIWLGYIKVAGQCRAWLPVQNLLTVFGEHYHPSLRGSLRLEPSTALASNLI